MDSRWLRRPLNLKGGSALKPPHRNPDKRGPTAPYKSAATGGGRDTAGGRHRGQVHTCPPSGWRPMGTRRPGRTPPGGARRAASSRPAEPPSRPAPLRRRRQVAAQGPLQPAARSTPPPTPPQPLPASPRRLGSRGGRRKRPQSSGHGRSSGMAAFSNGTGAERGSAAAERDNRPVEGPGDRRRRHPLKGETMARVLAKNLIRTVGKEGWWRSSCTVLDSPRMGFREGSTLI